MIIYCDGIFDLFHKGHLDHLKKIHSHFVGQRVQLLVGIINDSVATKYKRPPIFNENKRLVMMESIICVHAAFITDVLMISE